MAVNAHRIVSIRRWSDGDLSLLERLLGDPAMTVYLGGPHTRDSIRERHERYLRHRDAPGGAFVILVGRDEIPAGTVGYSQTSWLGLDVWEIGWGVLLEFQGQGVATAGAALAIARARGEGRHRFMQAFQSVDNAASNAVCRKLGFVLRDEIDIEYPPGNTLRSNHWRLDLLGEEAR